MRYGTEANAAHCLVRADEESGDRERDRHPITAAQWKGGILHREDRECLSFPLPTSDEWQLIGDGRFVVTGRDSEEVVF